MRIGRGFRRGTVRAPLSSAAFSRRLALLCLAIVALPALSLFVSIRVARDAIDARAVSGNERLAASVAAAVDAGIRSQTHALELLAASDAPALTSRSRDTDREHPAAVLRMADSGPCRLVVVGPGAHPVVHSSLPPGCPVDLTGGVPGPGAVSSVIASGQGYLVQAVGLSGGLRMVSVTPVSAITGSLAASQTAGEAIVAGGRVIADSTPSRVGARVVSPDARRLMAGGVAGNATFASTLSHRTVIDSYHPVPGTGLGVFVSLDESVVSSEVAQLSGVLWAVHALFVSVGLAVAIGGALQLRRRSASVREAERRYRTLAEATPDGVAVVDADNRLIWANRAMLELAREDEDGGWLGRHIGTWSGETSETAGDESLGEHAFLLRRADGTRVPVEANSAAFDVDGRAGRIAVIRDVSERTLAAQRERTTLETLAEGVVLYDLDTAGHPVPVLANPTAERLLRTDLLGLRLVAELPLTLLGPDGEPLELDDLPVRITARTGQPCEGHVFGIQWSDGELRWLRSTSRAIRDAMGEVTSVVVSLSDITDEHATRRELSVARDRFAALIEHGSDLITVVAPDGLIAYASPACASILGREPDDCVGRPWSDLLHGDNATEFAAVLASVQARRGAVKQYVARASHADGTWRHLEFTLANRIEDPAVGGVVANSRDVTDRVVAARRLSYQALHDSLTGLANRSLLLDQLGHALAVNQRTGQGCALLFLDLDHFKTVNDSLGHAAGDQLLVTVAQRLLATVRTGDSVARLGGDEFVVLADGLGDVESARELAARISEELGRPIDIDGQLVTVGVSVGVAMADRQLPDELLQEADTALYRAKAEGRNCVQVWDRNMRAVAAERLRVEGLLRHGVESALEVHYQPIVDLASGRTVGAEALARIRDADGRLAGPGEFMDVAEDSGLIVELGGAVLDASCRQQAEWLRTGLVPQVSVNVSARQLAGRGLVARVRQVLAATGLDPAQLCLELTESTLIDSGPTSQRTVEELRALGVSLALDDFGTGWSSLAYLRRFPIDTVKIDRSFVAGLGADEGDTEVVRAVIGLGHALGLRTVAEGVETVEQHGLLQAMGCDRAQGYLYGRPAPAGEWGDIVVPSVAPAVPGRPAVLGAR